MAWVGRVWVNVQEKRLILLPQNHKLCVVGPLERMRWEHALLRWRSESIIFQLFWGSNCTPSPILVAHVLSSGERNMPLLRRLLRSSSERQLNQIVQLLSSIVHSVYTLAPHSLPLCPQLGSCISLKYRYRNIWRVGSNKVLPWFLLDARDHFWYQPSGKPHLPALPLTVLTGCQCIHRKWQSESCEEKRSGRRSNSPSFLLPGVSCASVKTVTAIVMSQHTTVQEKSERWYRSRGKLYVKWMKRACTEQSRSLVFQGFMAMSSHVATRQETSAFCFTL